MPNLANKPRKAENIFLQTYPIQKKYHTAEYLRKIPHLRLRTPFNALLARLRSHCDYHLTQFFHEENFVRVQPPIITSSDCEGAGEVFTVDSWQDQTPARGAEPAIQQKAEPFFRRPKFLTVSSQLHLEAFVHEHQKVWTLSPTFRAEKSDTPRHLSEFWMLEAEIRTEKLAEVMDLVENMIRSVVTSLQDSEVGKELLSVKRPEEGEEGHEGALSSAKLVRQRWLGLIAKRWPRVTFAETLRRLQEAAETKEICFKHLPTRGGGLQLEHEKFIAAKFGKGSPVFVTDYPQDVKPFYMLPSANDGSDLATGGPTVACFDLLLPDVCEVVGGSLREHRLEPLVQSMRHHKLHLGGQKSDFALKEDHVFSTSSTPGFGVLDWYVDLRRYGSVPHGGFGLGFDRLLSYLAGVPHIRDVVQWPRYYQTCDC